MVAGRWWETLLGEATEVVDLAEPGARRDQQIARVRALPPGARVAVCDRSPASAIRCRGFARRAGLRPVRQFALLPGPDGPGFAVELRREAAAYFWERLFAVPGGPHPVLFAARLLAWSGARRAGHLVFRAAVPGRLLLGVRA